MKSIISSRSFASRTHQLKLWTTGSKSLQYDYTRSSLIVNIEFGSKYKKFSTNENTENVELVKQMIKKFQRQNPSQKPSLQSVTSGMKEDQKKAMEQLSQQFGEVLRKKVLERGILEVATEQELKETLSKAEQNPNIIERVDVLVSISEAYFTKNQKDLSKQILDKVKTLFEQHPNEKHNPETKARASFLEGKYLLQSTDAENAIGLFKQAFQHPNLSPKLLGEINFQLGQAFSMIQIPESAIKYFEDSLRFTKELKNFKKENEVLKCLTQEYSKSSSFEKANEYLDQMAQNYRNLEQLDDVWKILNEKGLNLARIQKYEDGIESHVLNLKNAKAIKNKLFEMLTLDQLVTCHENLGYYEEAIRFTKEMESVAQNINSTNGQLQVLIHQGKIYAKLNKLAEGNESLTKAEELIEKANVFQFKPLVQYHKGIILKNEKKITEAKELLEKSLAATTSLKDSEALESQICDTLGDVNLELIDYNAAKNYFHRSLSLHEKNGDAFSRLRTLSRLMKVYRLLEKHRDVAVYLDRALRLSKILLERGALSKDRFEKLEVELKKI